MRITFSLSLGLWLLGCGVKGDPLPPESPAFIGRGAPEMGERLKLMERQSQEAFIDFTRDEDAEDER